MNEKQKLYQKQYRLKNAEKLKKYFKEHYKNNKEHIKLVKKEYLIKNSESIKDKKRKYYQKNKNKFKENHKIYINKNKEFWKQYNKNYYETNKEKINKRKNEYQKNKLKNNFNFKLLYVTRTRIYQVLKNNIKSKITKDLLGCSIEEARKHIENQFKKGMTWDNHSKKGWHIDHIKPCASFDLTDLEQQKECFHYTNLQPLWWYENLSKGKKYARIN